MAFSSGMAAAQRGARAAAGRRPRGRARGRLHGRAHAAARSAPRPAGSSSWRSDLTDTEAVLRACEGAALLWAETPTNPLVGVAELDRLIEGAHAAGAEVVVDATFATPLLLRPLELGADVVIHSATKFIGGHSDLHARHRDRARRRSASAALRHARGSTRRDAGRARGVPRAARPAHAGGAARARRRRPRLVLAERLAAHPAVTAVHYPGLPCDPGHDRAARLMDGFGAMLAFEVAGRRRGRPGGRRARPRDRPRHEPRRRGDADRAPRALRDEATPEALLRRQRRASSTWRICGRISRPRSAARLPPDRVPLHPARVRAGLQQPVGLPRHGADPPQRPRRPHERRRGRAAAARRSPVPRAPRSRPR